MKTEDLKNYIFEQLNETSPDLKKKVRDIRWEQGFAASKDSDRLYREYMGQDPNGKPGKRGLGYRNPALLVVKDIRDAERKKAWAKAEKTRSRWERQLMGWVPEVAPKQESAFNFINGLKRLNETSRKRATALAIARGDEGTAAEQASRLAAKHFNKIKKQSWINPNDRHPDEIKAIAMARDEFTNLAYEKYRKSSRAWNRVTGLRGDGSPRTPN